MTSFLLLSSIVKLLGPFLKLCLVCDEIEISVFVPNFVTCGGIGYSLALWFREIVLFICCSEYMVGL